MKIGYVCELGVEQFVQRAEILFIVNELETFTKKVNDRIDNDSHWVLRVSQLSNSIYEFSLHSRDCINMIRLYDFDTPDVFHHDTFIIDERYRGCGLTYIMLESSVNICEGLGIPKITITTMMDGNLVWLKLGFLPREDQLSHFFNKLGGVPKHEQNHYWFTEENVDKHKEQIMKINWSGFAYPEMIKEIL